jgi:protein O-GlcNAc transferase
MSQVSIDQAMQIASQHHHAGRLAEAESIYRKVLAAEPNHADALHLLGMMAGQVGRFDEGEQLIHQAIAAAPDVSVYHCNLGTFQQNRGELDLAIASFQTAIKLRPDFPQAHYNLGIAFRAKGRLDEAVACHRRALEIKPDFAEAHNNLGIVLMEKGQPDQAVVCYQRALELKPDYAEALSNLGNAWHSLGSLDRSIAARQKAVDLKPDFAELHVNLGNALSEAGRLEDGVACYERALALKPDFAEAYYNLGSALKDAGRLDEAAAAYRKSFALRPSFAHAHSSLILTMLYDPASDARSILLESENWNRQHAVPLKQLIRPHGNHRDPRRPLRIGYVSPDFREHPVGRFILPLLARHDRQAFEVFCYAQVPSSDAITARLRSHANTWRSVVGLNDGTVAEMVRDDQIDILVDLAMHTAGNRILVFAQKPAPVQVAFAAYPGGTGLETMDWRLTDPFLDPPGQTDADYVEKSYRLPDSFWCYDARAMDCRTDEAPAPLPALTNGFLTFGCLNNFCKINPGVLDLWARVLNALPSSRLLMRAPAGDTRQRVLDNLARHDVPAARIEFVVHLPRSEYLAQFNRIDLCLDTFPYNGHATSLDALWMGVPVISRLGQTVVGRAGLSQLSNLNLTELLARSDEEFVSIAVQWASDLPRLAELRRTLRQRMLASPLMDAEKYTRGVENAYRFMWQLWCQTQ